MWPYQRRCWRMHIHIVLTFWTSLRGVGDHEVPNIQPPCSLCTGALLGDGCPADSTDPRRRHRARRHGPMGRCGAQCSILQPLFMLDGRAPLMCVLLQRTFMHIVSCHRRSTSASQVHVTGTTNQISVPQAQMPNGAMAREPKFATVNSTQYYGTVIPNPATASSLPVVEW